MRVATLPEPPDEICPAALCKTACVFVFARGPNHRGNQPLSDMDAEASARAGM